MTRSQCCFSLFQSHLRNMQRAVSENGPCVRLKCSDWFDPTPLILDNCRRCCAGKRRGAPSRRDDPCCSCPFGRNLQSDRYRCRCSSGRDRCDHRRWDRIRSGWLNVSVCATYPPIEKPSRSTCESPSAPTRSAACSAIASIVSGVSPLDEATPALSNRMTGRFFAKPSVTAGSQ